MARFPRNRFFNKSEKKPYETAELLFPPPRHPEPVAYLDLDRGNRKPVRGKLGHGHLSCRGEYIGASGRDSMFPGGKVELVKNVGNGKKKLPLHPHSRKQVPGPFVSRAVYVHDQVYFPFGQNFPELGLETAVVIVIRVRVLFPVRVKTVAAENHMQHGAESGCEEFVALEFPHSRVSG